LHRREQVCQVFIVGDVETALHPRKPEVSKLVAMSV
jgi:hypothetical protein